MKDTLARCEQLITDVDFASVAKWKSEHPGGKAIAYFPVYAPTEIIHAAGMLPVGLHGAGDRLDLQYADARFGSFICSIAKTTLELGMTQRLEHFDAFLYSSICDTARNLCFVLRRNFPNLHADFIHLPQNPASPATAEFLAGEYQRVRSDLERIGGRPIPDDAIATSIALYNRNRELTRELFDLRAASPQSLSTYELYTTVRAGNFLLVEEHNTILEELLFDARARSAKARDSIRVIVEGSFCEQPPLDLIRLIEAAGCYIVDDDLTLGRRWFERDVSVGADPLFSLADAYVEQSVYSSVRHDFRKPRFIGLIENVKKRRADAVIMLIAKFCEPALFDYVLFKRELEQNSIPHLMIEFEEKLFTFDRLQTEIETFVESLLFA
jgi:benzoyl-CoA reductase subunit C